MSGTTMADDQVAAACLAGREKDGEGGGEATAAGVR